MVNPSLLYFNPSFPYFYFLVILKISWNRIFQSQEMNLSHCWFCSPLQSLQNPWSSSRRSGTTCDRWERAGLWSGRLGSRVTEVAVELSMSCLFLWNCYSNFHERSCIISPLSAIPRSIKCYSNVSKKNSANCPWLTIEPFKIIQWFIWGNEAKSNFTAEHHFLA